MGSAFYIAGILVAILFFVLAGLLWLSRNKERIIQHLTEWCCYMDACERGWINPSKDENDRIALEYAIKHNKEQTWIVYD